MDKDIADKLYLQQERLNSFEFKIIELSKLINFDKCLEEKLYFLLNFKEKIEDDISREKIKLTNLTKDLNINVERIDKILSDSVIYPGLIGKANKYILKNC